MSAPPPLANNRELDTRDDIKPPSEEKQKDENTLSYDKEKEEISIPQDDVPYCVLPERQKVSLMLLASFAAIISPISSSIYFPAINDIAKDLDVSINLVNLTITTYLIFQGLAPSFIANFSDIHGRRPAYLFCFTVYLAANIGLAVQTSYPALMVLRCMQSSGSSGTIALGTATVSDLSTRAERGKYIGYATMGVTLGPALGPVIGGLLNHFLGWRWIFWFLVIFSGTLGVIIVTFYPETCRTVVGNGSVPPAKWNRSISQIIHSSLWPKRSTKQNQNYATLQNQGNRRVNPLASALIATEKEALMVLVYGSLLYAGLVSVMSTLTTQLQSRFGFNSIQIGLCYLPLGFGSLTSRWTAGFLLDWNFKREAASQGLTIIKNRQQEIDNFNVEVARLTITLPLVYFGALCLIAYGWVMQYKTALAGPMVMLFFMGHCTSAAFSSLSTLMVDTHRQSPATAVAANNLWRCLVGAGAIAAANPLIDRIGIGWTGTFIAFLWVLFSPILWAVYKWGHGWRETARIKNADAEVLENIEKGTGQ
ncbi:putative transporter AQR1 [Talaromyces islandicus]|uniref:Putative transporter AQR1 n=1 Tax=Talaromyces islandicus TaxID=28573 RepID=A0A0U1LK14_TALIS|nr:putative transporter AQR1 [Talaromyces islandicus]